MLVYYFVPFIVSNRYLLFWVSKGHNSVTVQNRTHVYTNFFHHKDLGNHLLQLCPKVVKHPVILSLYGLLSSGHHLLFLTTSLKSNLRKAVATHNTTQNKCIFWHAQNTTALQLGLFVTGIFWLLVTSTGRLVFPSANHRKIHNIYL